MVRYYAVACFDIPLMAEFHVFRLPVRIPSTTEEPPMPEASLLAETITLSEFASFLLLLHLVRHGQIDVDAINRELKRAGIMNVGHSFSSDRDSN